MERNSARWHEINQSRHVHEREALAYVRAELPDTEPYRAWANVEFLGDDGSINEVDLLVVTRVGVYLVELKAYPGRISGNAHSWRWTSPEGRSRTIDSPLLATDRKAKRLKSLLTRQKSLRGRANDLFIEPIVFLTDPELDCQLLPDARTRVFGRGTGSTSPASTTLPAVMGLLRGTIPLKAPRADGTGGRPQRAVDAPMSKAIADAMETAGIRPSEAFRRVGDYDLTELLDEGTEWQDWTAKHRATALTKRIRIWLADDVTTTDDRDRLLRAARREVALLDGINHPSIARPVDLRESERGPALVFDHHPEAQRLDRWLAERGTTLSLDTRLHVIREIAEAVRFAHGKRLFHRALQARCVSVLDPASSAPRVLVGDWQTIAREAVTAATGTPTTRAGLTGTVHLADLVADADRACLAPETFTVDHPSPRLLDVFGLGAIAYHVLTGLPAASTEAELRTLLREHGGLELAAAEDAPAEALRRLVHEATAADVDARTPTVDDLLAALDLAEEQLTAPEVDEPIDPLDARAGEILDGGWKVVRRLGKGSTAVALLAERNDRQEVLKVALDPEHHDRLRAEYDALRQAKGKGIVTVYDLDEIAGRLVLHLEPAGDRSLARLLREDGRLSLDLLARFGDDLLEIVEHLDDEGLAHRDIKPENLGVKPRGRNEELHLLLFDFSLARTPPEQIRAGTPGYLDPFLEERSIPRWDVHAERWAAAVTLHEMATGERPRFAGGSDPASVPDAQVTLDPDLFDEAVADGLTEFFTTALRRAPAERFGSAEDMRRAWRDIFDAIDETDADEGDRAAALDEAVAAATADTLLTDLPLTARVRAALDRLGVVTVGDLAAADARRVRGLRGVGERTRRAVSQLAGAVRDVVGELTTLTDEGDDDVEAFMVDRLAALLVPEPKKISRTDAQVQRLLIGLPDPLGGSVLVDERARALGRWPSQSDVSSLTGLSLAEVRTSVDKARTRWARRSRSLTRARDELHAITRTLAGVASADELAAALLTARGAVSDEPVRSARARAVVRAALEADQTLLEPRWVQRRHGDVLVVADAEVDVVDGTAVTGSDIADWALTLGDEADVLATTDPLPTPAEVMERLREVEPPLGLPPLPDTRLVRLAAACSTTAAASSRLELYPRGLDATTAVRLARPALMGRGTLGVDAVHAHVRARFPDAAELPGRPALDDLLRDADIALVWSDGTDDEPAGYQLRTLAGLSTAVVSTRLHAVPPDEAIETTDAFTERLERLARVGGFLALTVETRHLLAAEDAVARALGAPIVDLDETVIGALRAEAERLRVDWSVARRADITPGAGDWANLQHLVRLAMPHVQAQVLGSGAVVTATNPGLLARYDQMGMLDVWRDHVEGLRPVDGATARALVLLVPADDPSIRPTVVGQAVPLLTPASQWAVLPRPWLAAQRRPAAVGATA